MNTLTCKVCHKEYSHQIHIVKEMMLGMKDAFNYFECIECGCLQIDQLPPNIEKYYPNNYYSLKHSPEIHFNGKLKCFLKKVRDAYIITGNGLLGYLVQVFYPNQSIELFNFRKAKIKKHYKILDIGSGSGIIPYVFFNAGFTNVKGIDPYISKNITYNNGLLIERNDFLNFCENDLDIIMYNHSFEHLSNPLEHLKKAYITLKPRGKLIIRIPTVSSLAWRKYGVNWVQLDAPRHIFLYSIKSLSVLAEQAKFHIDNLSYESTYFQFAGSEQYLNNIPLNDPKSYFNGNASLFTKETIKQYKREAVLLNEKEEGDCISIILSKQK